MKQHEAVIEAMRQNGGYATLGYLYQNVLKISGVEWNTKTPFKSINRIVQTRTEFFKIKPGLWALTEYKDQLPNELLAESVISKHKSVEFNHAYYQGLLVEIGNIMEKVTYIPAQDSNHRFMNNSLKEIATWHQIPAFTYENIVRRARTIDVLWFNERKLPSHAFEVEHSTDIQNSLLKFVELQDFKIKFGIVADDIRRKEFESKLAYEAFRPIQGMVEFMSYEWVSDFHTRTIRDYVAENWLRL